MPDTAPLQVLLIEDEAILALDLTELLEREGYTVVGVAASGPAALDLLRQQRVELVLCDIRIQGPWDGVETARRLGAEQPGLPVVYLTALADRDTLTRALETGPAGYLTKPVSPANLRAAIEVARRTTPAAPARPDADSAAREPILRLEHHLFLKQNYQFVRLALTDIGWLEADNTSTVLVTAQGVRFALRLSLTATLERLHYAPLVRVHRSFALNVQQVESFSETEACVAGHLVPLGRQYKADFLRHFQQH